MRAATSCERDAPPLIDTSEILTLSDHSGIQNVSTMDPTLGDLITASNVQLMWVAAGKNDEAQSQYVNGFIGDVWMPDGEISFMLRILNLDVAGSVQIDARVDAIERRSTYAKLVVDRQHIEIGKVTRYETVPIATVEGYRFDDAWHKYALRMMGRKTWLLIDNRPIICATDDTRLPPDEGPITISIRPADTAPLNSRAGFEIKGVTIAPILHSPENRRPVQLSNTVHQYKRRILKSEVTSRPTVVNRSMASSIAANRIDIASAFRGAVSRVIGRRQVDIRLDERLSEWRMVGLRQDDRSSNRTRLVLRIPISRSHRTNCFIFGARGRLDPLVSSQHLGLVLSAEPDWSGFVAGAGVANDHRFVAEVDRGYTDLSHVASWRDSHGSEEHSGVVSLGVAWVKPSLFVRIDAERWLRVDASPIADTVGVVAIEWSVEVRQIDDLASLRLEDAFLLDCAESPMPRSTAE